MKVIDLSLVPTTGVPRKFTLDGAYWILKVQNALDTQTLDGASLRRYGSVTQVAGAAAYNVDFQTLPIFDATGKPVMWNQEVTFRSTATTITGTLTIVYWDPDKVEDRSR